MRVMVHWDLVPNWKVLLLLLSLVLIRQRAERHRTVGWIPCRALVAELQLLVVTVIRVLLAPSLPLGVHGLDPLSVSTGLRIPQLWCRRLKDFGCNIIGEGFTAAHLTRPPQGVGISCSGVTRPNILPAIPAAPASRATIPG